MSADRERLLRAYRQMKTIREFEERLHVEIATGAIPGFTHLYSGQEAIAVGVCEQLTRCGLHRQHASRPRPLHRQGLRCDRHDERDLRPPGRPVQGQGRLDAHRRCHQGHARRQCHRRRRAAARGRRGDRLQAARQPQCERRFRRRRQLQPGHGVRGDEPRRGAEGAGDLRLREQRLRRAHGRGLLGRLEATSRAARAASAWPPNASTARTSSRCTRRWGGRSSARSAARARAAIEATITRFYGHFEGDPQHYRAKDEVAQLREIDGLPASACAPACRGSEHVERRRTRCDRRRSDGADRARGDAKPRPRRCRRNPTSPPTSTSVTERHRRPPCRKFPCAMRSTRRCTRRWRAMSASSCWARTSPAARAAPRASARRRAASSASPRGCCRNSASGA